MFALKILKKIFKQYMTRYIWVNNLNDNGLNLFASLVRLVHNNRKQKKKNVMNEKKTKIFSNLVIFFNSLFMITSRLVYFLYVRIQTLVHSYCLVKNITLFITNTEKQYRQTRYISTLYQFQGYNIDGKKNLLL